MTQQFTTPEFSQVLKQHGIEIDTVFVHYDNRVWASHLMIDNCYNLIATDTGSIIISSNIEVIRAYPLTQVLGWLPKEILFNYTIWGKIESINMGKIGACYYSPQKKKYLSFFMPIEALIIQGLTEGWLNKDNITLTT